jgi:hypothetical protein
MRRDTTTKREKIERESARMRDEKMLFIQLVMTRRTRDVACVDLTCICASGVSMYIYVLIVFN